MSSKFFSMKLWLVTLFALNSLCLKLASCASVKKSGLDNFYNQDHSLEGQESQVNSVSTGSVVADKGLSALMQALNLIKSEAKKVGIGLDLKSPQSAKPGEDIQVQLLKLKEQAELFQMMNDMLKAETIVQQKPYQIDQDIPDSERKNGTVGKVMSTPSSTGGGINTTTKKFRTTHLPKTVSSVKNYPSSTTGRSRSRTSTSTSTSTPASRSRLTHIQQDPIIKPHDHHDNDHDNRYDDYYDHYYDDHDDNSHHHDYDDHEQVMAQPHGVSFGDKTRADMRKHHRPHNNNNYHSYY